MLPVRTCSPASRSVGLRSLARVCLEWVGDFAPLKFLRRGWLSAGTWQGLHRVEKLAEDRRRSSQDDLKVQ